MHTHQSVKFCPICASPLVIRTQMGEDRPSCPACGWVHYEDPKVATGVLVVMENQLLLVRRVMEPLIGHWSIPAGFVNAFEDPREAALRECREETGLEIRLCGLFDVFYGREHPRGSDILLVYRAEVTGGTLTAADDADEVGWFSLNDLPPLAFESTRKILARLTQDA